MDECSSSALQQPFPSTVSTGVLNGLKAPESSRNLWIKKVSVFKALRACILVLFH